MREIPLTNSDIKAIVDDELYEFLLAIGQWRLENGYVVMVMGAIYGHHKLQNIVADFHGIERDGQTIDHKNRVKHDCRLRNLRAATKRQNNLNRGKQSNNSTGFIGVSFHKHNGKFQAQASVNGKPKNLGYFDDPIEAARARDNYVRTLPDADFIPLNFQETASC